MINKREAIMFLIEECYKKFPELMEEIPEEKMYKTLEKNISVIKAGGKSEDFAGFYEFVTKRIKILNRGKINLEDITQGMTMYTHSRNIFQIIIYKDCNFFQILKHKQMITTIDCQTVHFYNYFILYSLGVDDYLIIYRL